MGLKKEVIAWRCSSPSRCSRSRGLPPPPTSQPKSQTVQKHDKLKIFQYFSHKIKYCKIFRFFSIILKNLHSAHCLFRSYRVSLESYTRVPGTPIWIFGLDNCPEAWAQKKPQSQNFEDKIYLQLQGQNPTSMKYFVAF